MARRIALMAARQEAAGDVCEVCKAQAKFQAQALA